jgi:thioesterase domain-containing protein
VVPIWSQGSRQPFFCVHPIGGNVLCYLELAQALGRDQPFYGVQSPRTGGAPPPRIEDFASRYVDAIREVQPEGPYALGGWSMGGLVAFEMARQLTARGEPVSLLAVIDSSVERGGRGAAVDDASLVRMFAEDMVDLAGLNRHGLAAAGPPPDEEAVLSTVLSEGQRRGVIPLDLSLDDARDMFRTFQRNHEAVERYEAGPYRGRVELFRAQSSSPAIDPAAGWRELAAEGVGVHLLPGDHYSLLKPPHVELLAERLCALISAPMKHSLTGGRP